MQVDQSQAQQNPFLVNYYELMKAFPKLVRSYKLTELSTLTLHFFLANLNNQTGNTVNLRERRWERRTVYCEALAVKRPSDLSRYFRELKDAKIMLSDKTPGKTSHRFLDESFLDLVRKVIPADKMHEITDSAVVTTKMTSGSAVVTTSGSAVVTTGVAQLYPRSMIEELANGTGEFKLAGWENDRQPAITIVGLAKRLEGHFDGFKDWRENNGWIESVVRLASLETVSEFVDYVVETIPKKGYGFTAHNRNLLWLQFMGARETSGK